MQQRYGIEGLSKIFADLPILIDEKQIDNNQSKVEEIVYMFANGKSKLRGTQTGGVQQNSKWRAIAISTGEEPLSNSKSQDGVRSRVLEIYGKPIENEEIASMMYTFTQEHYGLAGPIFVQALIKGHAHNNYSDIIKLYDDVKKEIKSRCPNVNFAQLSYIALITITDILVGQLFFKTDKESSLQMAEEIIENISKTANLDVIDNAYNFVKEWLLSNTAKFDTRRFVKNRENDMVANEFINDSKGSDRYGLLENNVFYIWPSKFNTKLEQQGFNPDKVKQGFKDRGYIITDNETSTTVKLYFQGGDREFIGFKLPTSNVINKEQLENLEKKNIKTEALNPTIPPPKELGLE